MDSSEWGVNISRFLIRGMTWGITWGIPMKIWAQTVALKIPEKFLISEIFPHLKCRDLIMRLFYGYIPRGNMESWLG